ncbi:malonate--CoA ligase [Tanacetum coccineum]
MGSNTMAYIIRQLKSSSTVKINPDSVDKNDPKDVQLEDEDIIYDITLSCRTSIEVVEAIASHGSVSHERVALIADDKSYGYKHLASSASRISLLLLRHHEIVVYRTMNNKNLDGARIGVVAKPSAEFIASVLAIWLSEGVAVPLEPSNPKDGLLHVMTDAETSSCFLGFLPYIS